MKTINKKAVVKVLNSFEIVEVNGGDSAYILVEDKKENRKALNKVGISNKTINKYSDKENICILSLGFSENLVDLYDGDKLIAFDSQFEVEIEKGKSIILYKLDGETNIAVSDDGGPVSTLKLTKKQLKEIKNVIA